MSNFPRNSSRNSCATAPKNTAQQLFFWGENTPATALVFELLRGKCLGTQQRNSSTCFAQQLAQQLRNSSRNG